MTDEEKKDLEAITAWVEFEESAGENIKAFKTILNLIEKQEKIIQAMAKEIYTIDGRQGGLNYMSATEVIEYFENKVGE